MLVRGDKIEAAGPTADISAPHDVHTIDLPNDTLIPGLIEGHSHLFLHPYNETPWNDQVTNESLSFRTAEATAHARATLLAGFTTVRDLGTEGAGYGDVGLKKAIEQGIVPGPADDHCYPRNRRDRQLRAEVVDRSRSPARRAGSERGRRDR